MISLQFNRNQLDKICKAIDKAFNTKNSLIVKLLDKK